ncbi:MAG: HAD family hydrolase [Lachnospiraceae bacterium]|nr:HAD family hydrolase [Lachnospiraceae bacterium]
MKKAVIFDMYETLITHYACPLYFSDEMAADSGISIDEFRKEWRETEHERSVGTYTTDEIVAGILKHNHCYTEELLNCIMFKRIQTKEECFQHMHVDILPLLNVLKERGILIGLISNCFSEEAQVIRKSILFPFFDGAVLSCEEGVEKPDETIFYRCLDQLGVKPEECIYVGDGGSQELEAAKVLGMLPLQALWYLTERSAHRITKKDEFIQLMNPMDVINYL